MAEWLMKSNPFARTAIWWSDVTGKYWTSLHHMGVSKNRGIPKSSIWIGFSIINHPFWEYPYFWKYPYILHMLCRFAFDLVWVYSCTLSCHTHWMVNGAIVFRLFKQYHLRYPPTTTHNISWHNIHAYLYTVYHTIYVRNKTNWGDLNPL